MCNLLLTDLFSLRLFLAILTSMADADSLYELSSDQDVDPDAMDGDVENDDTADDW